MSGRGTQSSHKLDYYVQSTSERYQMIQALILTKRYHSNRVHKLSPSLYRSKQGQVDGVPFDMKSRICQHRVERTMYLLIQNLVRSQKKLTDGEPTLTNVYLHISFLKIPKVQII